MKKSLLKTSWLMKPVWVLIVLFAPKLSLAQAVCPTDITACGSQVINYSPPGSPQNITTLFAGGVSQAGNMFDVVALKDIVITSFDGHIASGSNVAIYYKTGSYAGFEFNAAAWTLLGSSNVTLQPNGTPTPIPIPLNVSVTAGQRVAFYITTTNGLVLYSAGVGSGSLYKSDAAIQIYEGIASAYPFAGIVLNRIWNGNIHYRENLSVVQNAGLASGAIFPVGTTSNSFTATNNITSAVSNCSFNVIINSVPTINTTANQTICNNGTTQKVNFNTVCAIVGENGTLNISAPPGNVFTGVVFASYGSPTGSCGNFAVDPACNSALSTTRLNPAIGQSTFSIGATNANFGDPCSGTVKRLAVELSYGLSTAQVVNWTNSDPSIGLAASGTGTIPAFNTVNSGAAPKIATISATAVNGTCPSTSTTFTITANPTATVNAVANQTVCTGANTTAVNFSSPTTGGAIVYNWTNDNPSIGLAASGTGNIAAFTATNVGTAVINATVTVTPSYTNGGVTCAGTPVTFTISVNPPVSITTAAILPQATVATVYSTTLVAAGGSPTPNYTYAVTSGALPSGITLSSAGVLSGATLSAAGDYIFDVTATESACNNTDTKSFTLTLVKGTQTFTFAALPAKTYDEADFAAGATINTGNAITYTSSNTAVATIVSGNMIHIVGAGTADITASQIGDPSYNPATSTQTLIVNAAPLTVTAIGPAKAFGQALTAGTSTTNFSAGATQNSEVVSSVTLTPDAAGASATTPAGSAYTVTPSAATGANGFLAGNYNITYAPFNGIVGQTAQTISFNPLANATYGAAPITLTANSSSGLAVSYSSSNTAVATISGNTLTVVGAGTTIITASQNNNTNFTPAIPVDQSFTVDPKAITVTADARTKVYGVADPALTYTNTPLVGADAFSGALSRAAGENIGTYAIGQNTLALSSNYTLSYVGANLAITAKPVTVTATAGQTKVYGTADPVFAYTINTPLITGDVFTGVLTRATGENIGTAYAITQGNLALSSNYTISYTGANFSITAKPITAIADAKTKEYGSADPALTFTTDVPLIGTDAFTGNISRTAGENAGTYAINKNTLTLSNNYTLSYTTANLSITKKGLTITADNKVKFQGTANPALTASYGGFIAGENNTNLTAQPALSTTANNASVAGTYPIVVNAATSNNYAITFVPGTLTVTSGIPTSLSMAQATLYENRPAGTTAGSLSSTSLDPGATFTYTLVTGTGSTDNGAFSISGNQLLTAQSFDFETKNAYNIRVRTTTQYGLSLEQTFTVNISDVNEVPTLSAVADQAICYVTGTQSVALAGITAGPETAQSTTISVSSNNPNLFATLSVSKTGTAGTLSYSAKTGASGTATVTVTVQDNGGTANNGTDTFTRTFTITVFALPTPSITSNKGNSVGKGETIQLTATGGTSYVWAANNGIVSGQNTAVLTVRPSVTTTYTVTATNANGCSESASFTIAVESDYSKLVSTNILTPNNDGFNDKWVITNIDLYGNNEAKVFDKAGRLVYSKKNYDNSWDGTFNGAPLSEDTYYYIVDFGPGKGRLKGFITIIREQ